MSNTADDEITAAPATAGRPAPEPRAEEKFEIDFKADEGSVKDNKFAFNPSHLHKLSEARTVPALRAFGGIAGLANGLRTDTKAGLSLDEDQLDGTVTVDAALSAARSEKPLEIALAPESDSHAHQHRRHSVAEVLHLEPADNAFKQAFCDRRRVFGENRLPKQKQKSLLALAWLAFNDKLIFLLTASATISLALGIYEAVVHGEEGGGANLEWVESVTIMVAIVVIVSATALNDKHKAYKFEKLNSKKEEKWVTAIRSGKNRNISVFDLMVGDLVRIEAGDVIPTDGILVEGFGVQCDESPVSGESELVDKTPAQDAERSRNSAGDPFIYSGTRVAHGVGSYLVTAVGPNSMYGRIRLSLRSNVEETPLQVKLARLAKYIIINGFVIGTIFFFILFIRWCVRLKNYQGSPQDKGESFLDIFMLAVTVVVIGVPEGLSLAVAVALAFATTRMLKDNNLVRLLRSCETMGNATTICSDKTGTLTQNKMTVVSGVVGHSFKFEELGDLPPGPENSKDKADEKTVTSATAFTEALSDEVKEMLKANFTLNSTAFERDGEGTGEFVGSSTETALLKFGKEQLGMGPLAEERENAEVIELFPFNGNRKWMAVIVKRGNGYRMLVKGAAEVVLANCHDTLDDPETGLATKDLSAEMKDNLAGLTQEYASRLLRPIALAYRDLDRWPPPGPKKTPSKHHQDDITQHFIHLFHHHMTFVGIFGIRDPLRPEVIDSVRECQSAGVFVRMVTGDNFLTAKAIAAECGIYTAGGIALDGPTFRKLTSAQLDLVIPRLQVLARSSPDDKARLVQHLKKLGETVAVTGDGTNDAFALKAADVGFAMGMSGTEIAKEASSIILMDDNFASIVKALAWGRTVNDAAKKFIQFQFTINITAASLTIISTLVGDVNSAVFAVIQLLWLNLIMDIFAAAALATDYPTSAPLKRRPEPRNAPIINATMWKMILGQAIYQLAVVFSLHYAGEGYFLEPSAQNPGRQLQTFVFNIYMLMQVFNQTNCRRVDNKFNVFEGAWRNPWFIGVQLVTIAGQIIIVFKGGEAFQTEALTGVQWGWSIFFGFLTLPLGALIRMIPDSFVLTAGRVLSPLGFPVMLVVNWFRKRKAKRSGAETAAALERAEAEEQYYDEADEERRLRRMQWQWVKAGLKKDRRFFSRFWRFGRTTKLGNGNIAAGLATAGLEMAGANVVVRFENDRDKATSRGQLDDGEESPQEEELDLVRAIDTSKSSPHDTPYGLEVNTNTSKEDPVIMPEVIQSKLPPSQNPLVWRHLGIWLSDTVE
ncbi:uncharacterized protein E0L32_000901 [Thyridium curvatum]|uniref:Calcium-transporting ATPase n=1 Tax=Thyridium curvatum TaxID=1093900 RepID=A0A507B1Z4_9PEZI|nr:uncharacterized protein E0L32_000901 [Thyridium curvatum]TPX12724.1 hypothetical protein E0L32_000901 [Thyridium curvatum]